MQHAFVIEAEAEQGIEAAQAWAKSELGMDVTGNPDIAVLRYGLFSVADARKVAEVVAGAPFAGEHKVVVIAASRAYHEAQNALLKVFEEPPQGTYLFLILPTLGGLLPTLRSRVQELGAGSRSTSSNDETAIEFLKAGKEKRSAIIKKLATGKDDDQKREHREEAIALVNGIEAALFQKGIEKHRATLTDIATVRSHLYDRSAPVKMILEHLSLVIPSNVL
jgi:DNA polymerase III delta prime subunit